MGNLGEERDRGICSRSLKHSKIILENEFFYSQANKLLNYISSQCGIILQFEFGGEFIDYICYL